MSSGGDELGDGFVRGITHSFNPVGVKGEGLVRGKTEHVKWQCLTCNTHRQSGGAWPGKVEGRDQGRGMGGNGRRQECEVIGRSKAGKKCRTQ